jgi:hypothetical protein
MKNKISSCASTTKAIIDFLTNTCREDEEEELFNVFDKIAIVFLINRHLPEIFMCCQNQNLSYQSLNTRSMWIGDVIELENGDKWKVSDINFEKLIPESIPEDILMILETSYQRVESEYQEKLLKGQEYPEDSLMFLFGMLVDGIDKLLVLQFLKEKNLSSIVTNSYCYEKKNYLTLVEVLGSN